MSLLSRLNITAVFPLQTNVFMTKAWRIGPESCCSQICEVHSRGFLHFYSFSFCKISDHMWDKVKALNLKTTCKIDQNMQELQDKMEIPLIQYNGADWQGLFGRF